MRTSATILKTVFGLVVLWVLGVVGVHAWNTGGGDDDEGHGASCQSCAIDVNTLTSDSASTSPQHWSVQYLVDRDVKPQGYCCDQSFPSINSGEAEPDDNRGLALAPDGKHLYAGYNNGHWPDPMGNPDVMWDGRYGEVRKLDTSGPVLEEKRFDSVLYGFRGKAIAVDHRGRVYLAEGFHEPNNPPGSPDPSNRLVIYDADLDSQLFNFTIGGSNCPGTSAGYNCLPGDPASCAAEVSPCSRPEGVAVVTQQDPGLVLYVSDRVRGTLDKFVSSNGKVTNWTLAREFQVVSASTANGHLRGLAVDSQGRIWIADYVNNGVYVVDPSMSSSTFVTGISGAIDVAVDGVNAFVTTNGDPSDPEGSTTPPQIIVVNQTSLVVTMALTPPYRKLNPLINPCGDQDDPCGNDGSRLSGIVVTCPIHGSSTGGLYVANENGLSAQNPDNPSDALCTGSSATDTSANTCDREPIIQAIAGGFVPCAGCGKTTGGGNIGVTGPHPGEATFGFDEQAKNGMFRGQLEYVDHTNGADYHSVSITSLTIDSTGTKADSTGTIIQKNSTTTCTSSTPCYFKVHDEENRIHDEDDWKTDVFQITICSGGPCGAFGSVTVYPTQGGTIKRGDIEVQQCKKDDDDE
jgi:hypothetical protein